MIYEFRHPQVIPRVSHVHRTKEGDSFPDGWFCGAPKIGFLRNIPVFGRREIPYIENIPKIHEGYFAPAVIDNPGFVLTRIRAHLVIQITRF